MLPLHHTNIAREYWLENNAQILKKPTAVDSSRKQKGLRINRDLFRYQLQAEIQYRELPILFPTDCYQISLRILIRYETEKEPPHERRLY